MEWLVGNSREDLQACRLARLGAASYTLVVGEHHYVVTWHERMQRLSIRQSQALESELSLEANWRLRQLRIEGDCEASGSVVVSFELAGAMPQRITSYLSPGSKKYVSVDTKSAHPLMRRQRSPLTGKVVKLLIKAGEIIHRGETVAIIEAMKMQNKIVANISGIVQQVFVQEDVMVKRGEDLFAARGERSSSRVS